MLKTLLQHNRWTLLFSCVFSCLSAGASMLLLDYLNGQVGAAGSARLGDWLPTYLLGVVALFGASLLANGLMVLVSTRAVASIRKQLVRGILGTHFPTLEATGKGPLLAVLTDDVENLSEGLSIAPQFLQNLLTTLACCGYLAYLSLPTFAWFGASVLLGAGLTFLAIRSGNRNYEKYRDLKDAYYQHLHALFDGAKELATNTRRRGYFTNRELMPSIDALKGAQQQWDLYWHLSEIWTRVLLFLALGVALAAIQQHASGNVDLAISYFVTITFLSGAIDFVVNSVSTMSKAAVSARMIARLELDATKATGEPEGSPLPPDWRLLRFDAVRYTARHADGDAFEIGPVSLTLRRGEVLFLVGGNGSGKSTFAKLMNGLYQRSSGSISVDDRLIDVDTPMAYRALFSTIHSDYYLFASVLNRNGDPAQDQQVNAWLAELGLSGKVRAENGCWSTTALSQGQRKRLALVQTWLDDAPICLLDEWAADQDPGFRAHFYESILPTMKAQGKTLVVISHDERYFHIADRICKFEGGRMVALQQRQSASAAPQSA
jgi:cyclic peptide transporter